MNHKNIMRGIVGLFVLLIVFVGVAHYVATPKLTIKNVTLHLLLAKTEDARERGLGGISELKPDQAMLFIFENPGEYPFWMKDMRFAIDIIWLDRDFKIVSMEEGATPDSFPETFSPGVPSLYVLEVESGFARKNSLKIGDQFQKSNF